MPQTFRYRAFLSYSHKDKTWADWIHKALESFALGDDLAGRETEAGIVPKTLSPIFRDRDDFSAGPSLASQSLAALESSHSLVVLCSPRAAQSPYVNEEIRAFKALGRESRVFALIIDGEPGDPDHECFPPALRFTVGPDGALTDTRVEPIAADARTEGDGKRVALVKIVAGITGLPFNDIRKREVLAHKRAQRIRAAIAASISILGIGTGVFGWQTWQKGEQVQQQQAQIFQTQDLLKSLIGSAHAQGITLSPDQQQALGKTLGDTAAQAASGDKRAQKALELLQAGKQAEATALYQQIADDKAAQAKAKTAAADRDRKDAAAAYRNLASIARLENPKAAREAYAKALELDPEDRASLVEYAPLLRQAGDLGASERAALTLKRLAEVAGDISDLSDSHDYLGNIAIERGDLQGAHKNYLIGLTLQEQLVRQDPTNKNWQRNLAVAINKIGDIHAEQGNLSDALKSYQNSHEIAKKLATSNLDNKEWQRDLSVSFNNIGSVHFKKGNLSEALNSFQSGILIREKIAENDPANKEAQRDLSTSFSRIGDLKKEQGNIEGAINSYQNSLSIRKQLVKNDPDNKQWKYDLGISFNKLGIAQSELGNLEEAIQNYQDSLLIAKNLATSDPGHKRWQSNLSVAFNTIADAYIKIGNLEGALKNFQDGLAIAEQLTKNDPENKQLQRALSLNLNNIGNVQAKQGNLSEALKNFQNALEIRQQLAKSSPENKQSQHDLSISYDKVGNISEKTGKKEEALKAFEAGLAIDEQLSALDTTNATWREDVEISRKNVARVKAALAKQKK